MKGNKKKKIFFLNGGILAFSSNRAEGRCVRKWEDEYFVFKGGLNA